MYFTVKEMDGMNGWKLIGRDVYIDPPSIGGSVRVCDDVAFNWVESLSKNSAEGCIHVSIGNANYAPYGAFSGSRTSDGGGIGHMSLAYQDLKTAGGGAWGHYVECFMSKDAHPSNTAFGVEYGLVNHRPNCADVTPHRIAVAGMFDGIRVGVGKEPGGNAQNVSSMMTFLNTEGGINSVARKGLVFAYDAIKMAIRLGRKFYEVISLAKGFGLQWYDSVGNVSSSLVCNVDNALYAPHIEYTNGAIHFLNAKGVSQFSFNTETGVLYLGNESWNPVPLPQCPGSVGTVTFYVGGREMEVPCYTAR